MRAARMSEHPAFALMKQNDIQSLYYMQMPLWLFSDPRYAELNLDAKVTYTFLLNRFQLSRRNGWMNEAGEVFVIFPRRKLAQELRICEQRVTAAFRALSAVQLIWEKRCGRGDANQIYLAAVEPAADPEYECAPFLREDSGCRTAEAAVLLEAPETLIPQEPQDESHKSGENGDFKTAGSAVPEPQRSAARKNNPSEINGSHYSVSQSVVETGADRDGPTDEETELADILDACELFSFSPEAARDFENAIERLFYSEPFRIGNAVIPQARIRAKLRRLDGMTLREVERKLAANQETVIRNSTAYTMAVLFNCITEGESDLLLDPYLNRISAAVGGR